MCAAKRVRVTSHTAELAHPYISEKKKSYYQTKIYLIPRVGLLKVRALLSPLLPFLQCQNRDKKSKYERRTTFFVLEGY